MGHGGRVVAEAGTNRLAPVLYSLYTARSLKNILDINLKICLL